MKVGGRFSTVRHRDRVFVGHPLRSLSTKGDTLDVRIIFLDKNRHPLLLVSASRKTGCAADRNKFRRRVRMAFLAVLRKHPSAVINNFVLWVRPAHGNKKGSLISYKDIEKQLEFSLSRLRHP